jgi:3-deoxy-D-manno-octulosonate 8-phosphate phosphatase (KDO 8-P phosphatase)
LTGTANPGDITTIAADLKMLLLDVDGVLTDGGIILIGKDLEAKQFNVQDGMGIGLARAVGLKVGIVTSRSSDVVQRRATELNIDEVFQGVRHKTEVLDQLVDSYSIQASQTAFIGDDIQDIPIMKKVGMPIAVQNAVDAVKECSCYVTRASGGHGAVREAIEWLLDLRGDKADAYRKVLD